MRRIWNIETREVVRRVRLGALGALAFAALSIGRSDIGGGTGEPLSPYARLRPDEISPSLVQSKKSKAAAKRVVLALPMAQSETRVARISGLGLAFVKSGRMEGEVTHEFRGVAEDATAMSVPFSEISSLEVLGHEQEKLVVELRRFPAIEPEKLLDRKPTYLELRRESRRSDVLRIDVKKPSGSTLWFIGRKAGGQTAPVISLAEIAPGRPIVFLEELFDPEAYWWAIPSVVADPAYPYRVITRK